MVLNYLSGLIAVPQSILIGNVDVLRRDISLPGCWRALHVAWAGTTSYTHLIDAQCSKTIGQTHCRAGHLRVDIRMLAVVERLL